MKNTAKNIGKIEEILRQADPEYSAWRTEIVKLEQGSKTWQELSIKIAERDNLISLHAKAIVKAL